jgi:hypothetical protein
MAQATKPDREYKRPEPPLPEKRAQRRGGPSMKVSGKGGVKRQPLNPTQADRSAVRHADAMASVGGPADEYDRSRE